MLLDNAGCDRYGCLKKQAFMVLKKQAFAASLCFLTVQILKYDVHLTISTHFQGVQDMYVL